MSLLIASTSNPEIRVEPASAWHIGARVVVDLPYRDDGLGARPGSSDLVPLLGLCDAVDVPLAILDVPFSCRFDLDRPVHYELPRDVLHSSACVLA